jgi:hypothetical protein
MAIMDRELLQELTVAASAVGGITKLSNKAAIDLTQQLARAYVADPDCRWWWESVSVPVKRIPYGKADGLSVLAELFDTDCDAILIVTDDEEPPWLMYSGKVRDLIAMLRECRFFEYILVARDSSRIVFDTHMNELVVVV